jgi:hypothetical protein
MALIGCKAVGFEKMRARLERMMQQQNTDEPNAAIIEVLRGECNALIADARVQGAYTDRTGNLRSSIGCSIYYNGRLVEQLTDEQGTTQGQQNALAALSQYASAHPDKVTSHGYTLMLVAGMNYGRYVEAKGYNVLSLTIAHGETDMAAIRAKIKSLV